MCVCLKRLEGNGKVERIVREDREGGMMMGKKRFEKTDQGMNQGMNQGMDHPVSHQRLYSTNNLLPRIRIPLVNSNPHILHIRTERTLLQAILDQHSDFYPSTIAFNATDRHVRRNLRTHSINYHTVELWITSPPFSAYLLSAHSQVPIIDFLRHDLVQHRTERINVHLICRWPSRNQLGSDTTRQSPS